MCCPCIKSEHLLIVRLDKHWKRYKKYDEPLKLKITKYQLSVNNKIVNGMLGITQLTSFSRVTADRLLLIRRVLVSGTYTYQFPYLHCTHCLYRCLVPTHTSSRTSIVLTASIGIWYLHIPVPVPPLYSLPL